MKNSNPNNMPSPGTNPDVNPEQEINPSAPTAGTEGWGTTSDERQNIGGSNPTASQPGAEGAGDVRRTSYPRNEAADNPAASGGNREQALRDHPDNRAGKSFSCADAGMQACNWSVTGTHEDEIVSRVRDHAREQHGIQNFGKNEEDRVRRAIRDRAA